MSPTVHGSSDLLQRFAAGELEGELRDAVIAELASCAECRAVVGALARRDPQPAPLPRTFVHPPPKRLRQEGERIDGRYRIEAVLGEGGMGVVYRVLHELLGRRFALKMLHPDRAAHEGAVRRFLGEARTLASLGHEGIVDVVDLGHDDDESPFLVMELLEGETLEDRLRREGRMSLPLAFDAAARIAEALGVAHARGIVHRDVKPANVFLAADVRPGWVKLLDFGLAKLRVPGEDAAHEATLTRTGAVLGTPRYMAPEQWRAAKDLDARVDVFSWGVTVHRMLTGELPYRTLPGLELSPPSFAEGPDLRQKRPEVPLALAELVEQALSRDRELRPLDGAVLAARWREALAQFSVRRSESVRPRLSQRPPEGDSARSSGVDEVVVGRERELEALAQCIEARGAPLLVVGPEGVGKSALLASAVAALRASPHPLHGPTRVLRAEPVPDKPFAALYGLLGGAASSSSSAGQSIERALRELLFGTHALDAVLVIGDPSALDAESARLLAELGREVGAFMLGEARAKESAEILGADVFLLGGLDEAGLDALARSRGAVLEKDALRALLSHTGGHPLFALQCLALQRERGTSIDAIPAQLEDAIGARLAAAPPEAAHAWQVAAILRAPLTESDLLALGVGEARDGVAWLERRGILRKEPPPTGSTSALEVPLAFTAGLFAEVAEQALGEDVRALLHRSAAALRTRQLGPKSERRAWAAIGRHHERGGDLVAASDAYARAALGPAARELQGREGRDPPSSSAVFGPDEVGFAQRARWAEEALDLAQRAGRVRLDAVELALVRIEGLEGESRYAEAIAAIDALEASGWSADQEARALVRRGSYLQRLGRHDEARGTFARAERAARAAGLPDTLALALGRHAVCLALAGILEEARDRLLAAEELVLTQAPSRRADLAGWKAQVAGLSGDLGARRDAYWAAVELFRAEGNHRFAAFSLLNLGDTYARLGAYDEAERALNRAYAECQLFGAKTMAGYAALNLGYVHLRQERHAEALARFGEAAAIAERGGDRRLLAYTTLYRARAELDAAPRLDRLAALLGESELDPSFAAQAHATLARAALRRGELARALEHARAAEDVVASVGALEEGDAEVALAIAEVLDAQGDTREARGTRRRAAAQMRATAQKIAGANWRAHFLLDVPAHRVLGELDHK